MSSSKQIKPRGKRQDKLNKPIGKIDAEKKTTKQWTHYERLIYARFLLAFSMNQLSVNSQFCDLISYKIRRSAHEVYCYHVRELTRWGNAHKIVIQILGKKYGKTSIVSSSRGNLVKMSEESIPTTSDKQNVDIDEDYQLQSQEVNYLNRLMIEKSPDCYEQNQLSEQVQIYDLNLDEEPDYYHEECNQFYSQAFNF